MPALEQVWVGANCDRLFDDGICRIDRPALAILFFAGSLLAGSLGWVVVSLIVSCFPSNRSAGLAADAAGRLLQADVELMDSPGLDSAAPWPKYQRDNANTGNASLPLDPWVCP